MSTLEITKLVNMIDQLVRDTGTDGANKHLTLSGFIGGVIGSQLPLPSSPVKNSRIYYQDAVYPVSSNYISQINEAHIVDVDLALESAYLIWMDRYNLVHNTRVDAVAMMFRLHACVTMSESRLDAQRIHALTQVLSEGDVPTMNSIFLELLKQLQGDSGE